MTSASKERNMTVVKKVEILFSPGEFLAGAPLSKLSNESLLHGSDTILIELGEKCLENTLFGIGFL